MSTLCEKVSQDDWEATLFAIAADSTLGIRILWFHIDLYHGGDLASLLTVVLVLVAVGLPIWAIASAIGTPRATFTALGRKKSRWVGWMITMFLLGDAFGLILAIYYLVNIKPQLHSGIGRKQSPWFLSRSQVARCVNDHEPL